MKKDVIICLGDVFSSPKTIENMKIKAEKAVDLYKQGIADKIIFTGGFKTRKELSEAQHMSSIAIKLDISKKDIILEEKSYTTIGNAYYSQAIMDNNGFNSAIIVTSPYHIRRTKYVFEKIMKDKRLHFRKCKNNLNIFERVSYSIEEIKNLLRLKIIYEDDISKWIELELFQQNKKKD